MYLEQMRVPDVLPQVRNTIAILFMNAGKHPKVNGEIVHGAIP